MPTYIKIKIRRGSTTDWESNNPKLDLGEIGADMTKHRIKVGDGVTLWKDLPYCDPDLVNDLIAGGTDAALTAEQGKMLKALVDTNSNNISTLQTDINTKIDNTTLNNAINNLRNELLQQISISSGGGPAVVDQVLQSWNNTSQTDALSSRSGRALKLMIDQKADKSEVEALSETVNSLGIFGMGYTIDTFNNQSKPTKITFEDGVIAELTWLGGTQLQKIKASTGEVTTINYDEDGKIIGRTVTR